MTGKVGARDPALVNDAPAGHRPSGFDPARIVADAKNGTTRSCSIYDKPVPARVILAERLGISTDEAKDILLALVEGGYGIAPRNPTNGMLAGYIEATYPARGHEAIITAIGKARKRWQIMLAHGTEMAMSLKYAPAIAMEAKEKDRD